MWRTLWRSGFLGLELDEAAPDHSTISWTRRLIDVETHERVFTWVLERLAEAGPAGRTDAWDRCDDAGGERGDAKHRAA